MPERVAAARTIAPPGLASIYVDGGYLQKNPTWHVEESPWKARQIQRMLKRHALQPRTICDAGCGAGEVLKQLQFQLRYVRRLVGYEISPQAFALCRQRANERLEFRLADITLDAGAAFDLMLVLDVIEHLEDYYAFLRAVRRRSEYAIFHIPLDLCAQTVVRANGLLKRRDLYAHIHYFTKETALRTLTEAGYVVLDYFYTPRMIDLPIDRLQRALRLPRRLAFAVNQDLAVRALGGFSLLVLTR